jgi:hypothetical protein
MMAWRVAHSEKSSLPVPVAVDLTVLREVRQMIVANCYAEVRNISARFRDCELILDGEVTSYYLKQIAQTIVRDVRALTESRTT